MLRVINSVKPAWIVGENVDGIINLALDDVLADLEGEGYETRAFVLPACGVGAAHRRYRVAIVGHAKHDGLSFAAFAGSIGAASGNCAEGTDKALQPAGTGQPGDRTTMVGYPENSEAVADAAREQDWRQQRRGLFSFTGGSGKNVRDPSSKGFQDRPASALGKQEPFAEPERSDRGEAQRRVGDTPDGFPGWVSRPVDAWDCDWDSMARVTAGEPDRINKLKALGNAVVPQQFYPIFAAIAEIERKHA